MKTEIKPAVIVAVVIAGLAVIAGAWFMSGGNGQMSPTEQKMAEQQTQIQSQHFDQNLGGGGGAGSEAEARAKREGSGN